MKRLLKFLTTEARKFTAALVGAVAVAVSQGLIDGTAAKWTAVVIALVTAPAVYQTPNVPAE